ncbi:unnamed protein product, partial [Allacma fusca]
FLLFNGKSTALSRALYIGKTEIWFELSLLNCIFLRFEPLKQNISSKDSNRELFFISVVFLSST